MVGLDRAEVEPIAVTLHGRGPVGDELAAAGHTVIDHLARGRQDLQAGGRLRRALRDHAVEAVVVPDSPLPLFWAGWLKRTGGPRLVLAFHSTGRRASRLQHAVANACALPVADRFVALAASHARFLERQFGLDEGRIRVIGNGVDTQRFHPAADRSTACAALGLEPGDLHVGIVAALRPEKHHTLFLRAAALLAPQVSSARFLIVGDGPERAALERECQRLDLGSRVSFMGARDDMPAVYQALDLAVLCSHPVVETFPVTLLEAMASGVPAVSTGVGSISDIVADGETGVLVPPDDETALAGAIERLLGAPALRADMARAARARAEACFTLDTMIRGYERLFAELSR
jgi:glycosyltransferase involved in cell wall biosynthesis